MAKGRSNTVRIIGGEWRRRLITFPSARGLRPTPDRVRETLFNWLGQDLTGLSCLDLFAGSGAMGFEAASRGAARVVMVDSDREVAAALGENARALAIPGLEVLRTDALQFAAAFGKSGGGGFDVLFLDPPYGQGLLERIAPYLPQLMNAANEDAVIYAEAEHPLAALGDWSVRRQGRAGQVCYHLLSRNSAHAE